MPRRTRARLASAVALALVASAGAALMPPPAVAAGCDPTTHPTACAPANDDLADAIAVTPGIDRSYHEPHVMYGSTEPSDPVLSCKAQGEGPGYDGVWYSITPTTDVRVTIDTLATTLSDPSPGAWPHDTTIAVYQGTPSRSTEIACSEDASIHDFRSKTADLRLMSGFSYFVHVALWSDVPDHTSGELITKFTWGTVPGNDRWVNAVEIAGSPYSLIVTDTQHAAVDPTDPNHSCAFFAPNPGMHSLWWTITPERNGLLDLDTTGSSGTHDETLVSVHTGAPGSFVEVACSKDTDGVGNLQTRLTGVPLRAGVRYSVLVSHSIGFPPPPAGAVHLAATFTPTDVPVDPVVPPPGPAPTVPSTPEVPAAPAVAGRPDVRADRTTGAARPGTRVTYPVTLRNDAELADVLTLRGARSSRGFAVTYRAGRKNITRGVTKGTFTTPTLAPGATYVVTVVVTVTKRATKARPLTTTLTARSRATTTATDAVRLVTRRR